MKKAKVNCYNCKHFYVTWDRSFPKGCKALGFKSQQMPSMVVYQSAHLECLYFAPK